MDKLREAIKIFDEEINTREMIQSTFRLYRKALTLLREHEREYEQVKHDCELYKRISEIRLESYRVVKQANERLREYMNEYLKSCKRD